ncbi:very-long-chain 3-oxoacyl-CoA reductase-B-like isoform X1 [Conger conger]|uniref:very-long-chain 3-oxoacyl-CoA reductase-B-like isoform X1 n=1 Tax=Conger conger TaxID=82655 RepID=UPI002A59E163|nr:very-long-chain 3-oxoacyl-CoA reductase-B-like isoform X1 [Conger conger]
MSTDLNSAVLFHGLSVIGSFTVLFYFLKFSWKLYWGVRVYVLSEYCKTDLRKYGQWAVVTGATSGIGRAYANELAKRGLDIVLVSRSEEKLHIAAMEIEKLYGRKTRIIQADFTVGHAIYPAIAEGLRNLDIGILVNNVGMNYVGALCFFLDVANAEQRITEVINCNILSVTQMTRLVLPHMVEKGTGLIINLSSEVASQPQPLLTLYCATKIFVTYFSRCLNSEYSTRGVTIQCVTPFMVSTNMTYNADVNAFVKSAADYAREALNTVGHSTYTSGCLSHALQHVALTIFFPGWLRLSSFWMRWMDKFTFEKVNETMATSKKEN